MQWRRTVVLGLLLLCLATGRTQDTCNNTGLGLIIQELFNSTTLIINENYTGFVKSPCGTNYSLARNLNVVTLTNITILSLNMNSTVDDNDLSISFTGDKYMIYTNPSLASSNSTFIFVNGTKCTAKGASCTNCSVNLNTTCSQGIIDPAACNCETQRLIVTVDKNGASCLKCNILNTPKVNITIPSLSSNGEIDSDRASEAMANLSSLLPYLGNQSSAKVFLGNNVGLLMKIPNTNADVDVSISQAGVNTLDNQYRQYFDRVISIPLEALGMAKSQSNNSFLAVFSFHNMKMPEQNNSPSVLNGEVIAIEMGAKISGLKSHIEIVYKNMSAEGMILSCSSWDGSASSQWKSDGCKTVTNGSSITCQCNHLTFFAILMAGPNITLSSSDIKSLTFITYIGCGLSMFFLGVALFMHFILRKAKSNKSIQIIMNLFLAMFLLDVTFLSNDYITGTVNRVGCIIMAAVMHYCMLSTFTWFAIEAFHMCYQLIKAGSITIKHYVFKVSIIGWVLPFPIVVLLLSLGKYGNDTINSSDGNSTSMCWITDNNVHLIVNIGYYVAVFIFTFTAFVIVVNRLVCMMRKKKGASQPTSRKSDIFTILGLCCLLGLTWGFAFLSYGPLKIPSLYIFTILNSFQGFFLFLYYCNSSKIMDSNPMSGSTSSEQSSATTNTTLETSNPYNTQHKKTT